QQQSASALGGKAKGLGQPQAAATVTPEMLVAWHRKPIARKYDGGGFLVQIRRSGGIPPKCQPTPVPVVLGPGKQKSVCV
ncbi:MAG: hypothetical protein WBY44_04880, partial [Bryobacteraceae bacterium]